MLKGKKTEKIGFWVKIGKPIKEIAQPTQSVREPVDPLSLLDWGPVEKCKKSSLSSSELAFLVEERLFLIEEKLFLVEALSRPNGHLVCI